MLLTIFGMNDRPVVRDATATIDQDTSSIQVDVTDRIADPDVNDGFYIDDVVVAGGGSAYWVEGGIIQYSAGNFRYLGDGESADVIIRYTVIDDAGASASGRLTITVRGINDAPTAKNDRLTTREDEALVFDETKILKNDQDPDANDILTISFLDNFVGGTASLNDGVVTFTPDQNFNSNVFGNAGFDYMAIDSSGEWTTGHVTVVVRAVDDAAVAVDDYYSIFETDRLTGNVISADGQGQDYDADGTGVRVSAVNGQAAAVGTSIMLASGATLRLNSTGSFSYDGSTAFAFLTGVGGAVNTFGSDSFTYTLATGNTATVTIGIRGESTPGDVAIGDATYPTMSGTDAGETFIARFGGILIGEGGSDQFYVGAALPRSIISGEGRLGSDQLFPEDIDTVIFQGQYEDALLIGAGEDIEGARAALLDIDSIIALSGFDSRYGGATNRLLTYVFTTTDAVVDAGKTFTVAGATLQAGERLTFDGSAETDESFVMIGGRGADGFGGGARNDVFLFGSDAFGASDRINGGGGGGSDTLVLQGNYNVTLDSGQLANIRTIFLASADDPRYPVPGEAFDYVVRLGDIPLAGGGLQVIDASGLAGDETMTLDASAVTQASVLILGGSGADVITGGAQAMRIEAGADDDTISGGTRTRILGGEGADKIDAGKGVAIIAFAALPGDSSGLAHDVVSNFRFGSDQFDVGGNTARYHRDADVLNATIDSTRFNVGMTKALNGVLTSDGASFVTASAGDLAGTRYLVVDQNGIAGYQAGEDLVIELIDPIAIPAAGVDFLI